MTNCLLITFFFIESNLSIMSIQLIVGLCNPGSAYEKTRHNAGEWFVNAIADSDNVPFKLEKKFFGKIAMLGNTIVLLPNTFMNMSGQSVKAVANFYKISAENILVAHDELDLPPGIIKIKTKGGHGGHNGLRDIINQLGTKDFYRLRIGIGHPGHRDLVTNFVLGKPSNADKISILNSVDRAIDVLPNMINGEYEKAMHQLHT